MFLIVIRWVSTFYRYYSRYFHQSVWLSGYYCFLLGQYSSVRLKCILEVFSKAIISRRPYSVLLGFLEQTLWTLWTFISYPNNFSLISQYLKLQLYDRQWAQHIVMGCFGHEQFLFSFSFIFWLYRDFCFLFLFLFF